MTHLSPIFTGKLNDDCYLFTIKLVDIGATTSADVGTVIINTKTGNTHLQIDNISHKYIDDEFLVKAINDSIKSAQEIQKIL